MLPFLFIYAALAIFFGWYATVEIERYRVAPAAAAGIYICFLALAGLYLAPGFAALRARLKQRVPAAVAPAVFLAPYLIYTAGTADFRWLAFAKLVAIAVVPLGVFAAAPVREPLRLNWQDGVALLWLYVPVQFHLTSGIWTVPVNLDFMARLYVVGVGAWAFLIVRGVEQAGYDFTLSSSILRDALVSFVGFSAIALPLGWAMRFLAWNPQWRGLPQFLVDYLTIFLFVAIAEELFFRGLLQNLFEGSLKEMPGSRNVAQSMVSLAFGFSHIQHAPAPNWRYVALATVAGWFYGLAYRKHRSLMASAGTHALVDTLWRTFFTLPGVV
jgi:membrane protease YdiL (CAAX protease family)